MNACDAAHLQYLEIQETTTPQNLMALVHPTEATVMNVLGEPLERCSCEPITGWYRDGFCKTDATDIGQHTVCCIMTDSFLRYSKAQGNDLSTPIDEFGFPGLKAGDHWCLCAPRWKQAFEDGMAPLVHLKATEISALQIIGLELLMQNAYREK